MPPMPPSLAARAGRARSEFRDGDTPPDESSAGTMAERTRVYLTWPRALLCGVLLMVFTGGRGGIFLCVLLGLTLLIASRSVTAGARGLGLRYQLREDRIFSGGRARIEVAVVNRSRWPLPLCEVAARLPDGLHGAFHRILTIPGRTSRRAAFEVTGIRRGVYRLGDTRVVLSDWFGLFQETADVPVPGRLLVYPAGDAPADRPLPRLPSGPRRDPASPFTDELPVGVRDYRPGDALRTIAWKQTARRGTLLVRQHPPVREAATWIYVDLCSDDWDPLYRHDRTEAAIGAAAALVRRETAAGRAVGLALWGSLVEMTVHGAHVTAPPAWIRCPPRSAPGQALHLLEVLAAVRPEPGPDFEGRLRLEAAALPWGTRAVVLVPRDTPALWRLGAAWEAHGHPVTLLVFERRLGRPPGLGARRAPQVRGVGAGDA